MKPEKTALEQKAEKFLKDRKIVKQYVFALEPRDKVNSISVAKLLVEFAKQEINSAFAEGLSMNDAKKRSDRINPYPLIADRKYQIAFDEGFMECFVWFNNQLTKRKI